MNKRLFKKAPAPATLREVARAAGLSVSVVSRALNPRPDRNARVSEETVRRVRSAARRLAYRPNRAAEFLKRGRAPTIGAFLPMIPNRLVADLVIGMAEAAGAEGFPLSFAFGLDLDDYQGFLKHSHETGSCGIVTYPYFDNPEIAKLLEAFRAAGGHVVLLNSETVVPGVPVVSLDNRGGGRLAAGRLLERGCGEFLAFGNYPSRSGGFAEALGERGAEALALPESDAGLKELARRCRRSTAAGPVGVFAVTDFLAMRVIRALRGTGRTVGREVLLVGYDDLDAAAETDPPLTTIHQPFREEGRVAVAKILGTVYGRSEESATIPVRLVVRETA